MANIPWDSLKRIDDKQTQAIIKITAATALLYSTYRLLSYPDPFAQRKGTKEIPIPDGCLPYIGHLFRLRKGFASTTMDWHNKFGPILHIRMGVQHMVLINDPYLAHKIHVTHGSVSNSRPSSFSTNGNYSHNGSSKKNYRGIIIAPYGPSWKKSRTAALSILAPNKLKIYAGSFDKASDSLVERLIYHSEKEGGILPRPHLEFNTLNFISMSLFGKLYDSMEDPEFIEVANVPRLMAQLLDKRQDISTVLPILSPLKLFNDAGANMKRFVDDIRDPLLLRLIDAAVKRDGHNLVKEIRAGDFGMDATDEEVIELTLSIGDLLFAATDTSASSVSWLCAVMCHHRDIQDKVYNELNLFVQKHGRLPDLDERNETPYTFAVIRESSRYRAPINFNVSHLTTEEIEFDGYIIPKNTIISFSMDSGNRNPKIFDNPEEFIPERYINNTKSMTASANGKIEERDHYSFGWGRRICPGAYLAEMQIYSVFTRIMHRCIIEASGTLPNLVKAEVNTITTQPRPYKAKFIRR
ncbi:cytochrome P450 [Pilobolus umbonatus]|nr:cytochrome P450 [Pilobolus umbonatus]